MLFLRKRLSPSILLLSSLIVFVLFFSTGMQTPVTVTLRLFDSSGNPLTGGSCRYYDGSWNSAVDNGDGTFTVMTAASSLTYEMSYAGASQTQSGVPVTASPVDFQTRHVVVQLKNSSGSPIDTGMVQYYAGTWMDFGVTSGGESARELLSYNYKFRINYSNASQEKYQNVGNDPVVVFQTVNVTVQLQTSASAALDTGVVKYYAGTWQDFGSTSGGQVSRELLPYNYKFRMTYAYASNEKYQDVGNNPTVVFQTKNVAVQLQTSASAPLDTGVVKYYAGTWNDFGTTSGGQVSRELLPYNYKFRMTYAYASNEKYQDVGTNPTVVFQTKNVAVQLQTSASVALDTGVVKYYAGTWNDFGTTSGGKVNRELLPYNYKFRMTYAYTPNEKYQDVGANPTVVFQTKNVTVQLRTSASAALDTGAVKYYSGAWHDIGVTSGGQVNRELLPYNYKFRMTYAYASNEKYQDVGANPTVVFQTVLTSVLLKDKNGILIDRGVVLYYSGLWKPFGSTTGGLVEKQLLPYNYKFRMTFNSKSYEKYQNTGTDPVVIFQMDYVPLPPTLIVNEPADGISTENGTITVAGSTDNASVTIKVNGIAVPVASDGSFTTAVSLMEGPNTITIIATNSAGTKNTVTRAVTRSAGTLPPDPVTVAPPLEETVAFNIAEATEFLYTGPNPIQTEVDTAAMEPVRACVLRGKVCTADGEALSGVAVTILNHPEFGKTLSRTDGWFDMAVNGGGYLTVDYSKSGYLPAQRQVEAPWQDFAVLDSVALVQLDPQVTTIDFSDTIEVARGSVVTDQDGTRQATLLFSQGTQARMILANGDSVALDSIHVRATEYTVGPNGPMAMPAVLPPNVAYTYCVELSADEAIQARAVSVSFQKPVHLIVDNFIGFPVGAAMPVGYYDRQKGVWVPMENGCVIGITGVTSGLAEVDMDGDGSPESQDDLAARIGMDAQERRLLAASYIAGQSLWRAPISHFSVTDLNCAGDLPKSVKPPKQNEPEEEKSKDDCGKTGQSTIGIQNQTLGEAVPLTGTGMALHYESDRVAGRLPVLNISISDSTLPESVKKIDLVIQAAGKVYTLNFPAQQNLRYLFQWDRRDAYGRFVNSRAKIKIEIRYYYDVYYSLTSFECASTNTMPSVFGALQSAIEYCKLETAPISARIASGYLAQKFSVTVGEWKASENDLGGWSISEQHSYDPFSKTVNYGYGSSRSQDDLNAKYMVIRSGQMPNGIEGPVCTAPDGTLYFSDWYDRIYRLSPGSVVTHVAGSGETGYGGEDKPAVQTTVDAQGMARGPDGSIYIVAPYTNRVQRIDPNGVISTVAGNGVEGFSGDGGPAVNAMIEEPYDVAIGPDGSLYIAFYSRIRKVDTNGIITTVAGYGNYGFSGDGGPAVNARFNLIAQIIVGPDQCIYAADYHNHRIRRIGTDGIVQTIAGNGSTNYSGDGGPAVNAGLQNPAGLVFDSFGNLFVSNSGNQRIRKINTSGIISTVAGDGIAGFRGDGGPASASRVNSPTGMDIGPDGSIYFCDMRNYRIRKIDSSGMISSVAGNGIAGYNGDEIPAVEAQLNWPYDTVIDPAGNVYIADYYNNRVRRVDTAGIIHTSAGNGDWANFAEGVDPKEAFFSYISDLTIGPDGCLFIAEADKCRIRKVDMDGLVKTVAGNGEYGYSGDNGPAVSASLDWPTGVAVAPDGSVIIADNINNRIRRVGPDGTITTIAGCGESGFDGDGGIATFAHIDTPEDVEISRSGDIYFSDSYNNRVRKVDINGIITTVAGNGDTEYNGDGIPATEAAIAEPKGLALSPNGELYILDTGNNRIRKVMTDGFILTYSGGEENVMDIDGALAVSSNIASEGRLALSPDNVLYYSSWYYDYIRQIASFFPKFGLTNTSVASEDGKEIYVFNRDGRHLRTVDALTDSVIYRFQYTEDGRLSSIVDMDGLVTRVERNGSGKPVSILSPFGQRTSFTLDSCGYLAGIVNPAGEANYFKYTNTGLMTEKTDARAYTSYFRYDGSGRLIMDEDPVGGFTALSSNPVKYGWATHVTTAEGRKTSYVVENLPDGSERMTNTWENGLSTISISKPDGSTTITQPNGSVITSVYAPDPQYGMQAPLLNKMTVETPSGLISVIRQGRKVNQLSGLEVTGIIDTVTTNGKSTITVYDGQSRTYTTTSPEGRFTISYVDEKDRVVQDSIPGILSTHYTYDDQGFLTQARQGHRVTHFSYNDQGRLETVTDPLNRTATMDYDSVGRVVHQTLADGRVIDYSYDANGNLTTLTPPGKPAHAFSHTSVNMTRGYYPPLLPDSTGNTGYLYNLDRQIVQTLFSDSSLIQVVYDTTGCGCGGVGKPAQIIYDRGMAQFMYDNDNGNLTYIVSPTLDTLKYTYDGSLPESVTWNGSVNGSVGVSYNNDFQVTSQTVNGGNSVSFSYDNDGLLTSAGSMTVSRNTQNGLMTGTALGNVTTGYSYTSAGELSGYTAQYGGSDLFKTRYHYDKVGRIDTLWETALGIQKKFVYHYDLAGRLERVDRNDTTLSVYHYDSNGNRLSHVTQTDSITGVYDDQDRMLSYGNATFGYTATGSMRWKAENGDTTWYDYDLMGNLVFVNMPDGTLIQYLIDGQNRRVGKVVNGKVVKRWLYQNQLNIVAELDNLGNVESRFVYGTRGHVPDYMVRYGVTYRFITDHLGSVRSVIDVASGDVVQYISYDEFGNILIDTNPGFQPLAYAGGLYDRHTDLVRFGARDYNFQFGRWTSKDPIGFFGNQLNLYSYCYNNSISNIDPSGKYLNFADQESRDQFMDDYVRIYSTDKGKEMISNLAEDDKNHLIKRVCNNKEAKYKSVGELPWHVAVDPCNDEPYIYRKSPLDWASEKRDVASETRKLAHELGHLDASQDQAYFNLTKEQMDNIAIQEYENPIMMELGEGYRVP